MLQCNSSYENQDFSKHIARRYYHFVNEGIQTNLKQNETIKIEYSLCLTSILSITLRMYN